MLVHVLEPKDCACSHKLDLESHFESVYYLTFQYLPPKESVSKISKIFIESSYKADHDYEKVLDFFCAQVNRLFDVLADFMFEAELVHICF